MGAAGTRAGTQLPIGNNPLSAFAGVLARRTGVPPGSAASALASASQWVANCKRGRICRMEGHRRESAVCDRPVLGEFALMSLTKTFLSRKNMATARVHTDSTLPGSRGGGLRRRGGSVNLISARKKMNRPNANAMLERQASPLRRRTAPLRNNHWSNLRDSARLELGMTRGGVSLS
jgi:hypothetical protein